MYCIPIADMKKTLKEIWNKIKKNHELNTVSDDQKYDDSKSGDDYYDSPFNGVFQG